MSWRESGTLSGLKQVTESGGLGTSTLIISADRSGGRLAGRQSDKWLRRGSLLATFNGQTGIARRRSDVGKGN